MTDWLDELDAGERREWDRFVQHVRRETLGAMTDSAFVMSLVPTADEVDVKFAVELGLAIMLDKPLIAVVMPGVDVPNRLWRVADEIVRADVDTEAGRKAIAAALQRHSGAPT